MKYYPTETLQTILTVKLPKIRTKMRKEVNISKAIFFLNYSNGIIKHSFKVFYDIEMLYGNKN